MSVLLIIILSC